MENTAEARNADTMQRKILTEQAPIAPVINLTNGRLIKPWVKGYPLLTPGRCIYSRTMYIVKL